MEEKENEYKIEKVYLSGPITSDPDGYTEHFAKAERYLRNSGFNVLNPSLDQHQEEAIEKHSANLWSDEAWADFLKKDIDLVPSCDTIAILDGYKTSYGAMVEILTAARFGLGMRLESEDFKILHKKGEWAPSVQLFM